MTSRTDASAGQPRQPSIHRAGVLAQLETLLNASLSFALSAPTGFGKTQLLNALVVDLQARQSLPDAVVLVSLGSLRLRRPSPTQPDFLIRAVSGAVVDKLPKQGVQTEDPQPPRMPDRLSASDQLRRQLEQAMRAERRLVLLIDDADAFVGAADSDALFVLLRAFLEGLKRNSGKLSHRFLLGLAIRRQATELIEQIGTSPMNNISQLSVPPFTQAEVQELADACRVSLSKDSLVHLTERCGGIPALIAAALHQAASLNLSALTVPARDGDLLTLLREPLQAKLDWLRASPMRLQLFNELLTQPRWAAHADMADFASEGLTLVVDKRLSLRAPIYAEWGPQQPDPAGTAKPSVSRLATPLKLQVRGAISKNKLYVGRPADYELIRLLGKRELCYVFATRQIGKTSLLLRSLWRLEDQGIQCAVVDLSALGTSAEERPWYLGICLRIGEQLELRTLAEVFFEKHKSLLPVQVFQSFLRTVVLEELRQNVVIFLDEIDATLVPPLDRDGFFGALRSLHDRRAEDPQLERLTFCLFGVATPMELVSNPSITPFNVGCGVALEDFTIQEAGKFKDVLSNIAGEDALALLQEIYAWTAGHPYMTQRLCEVMSQDYSSLQGPLNVQVKTAVEKTFLNGGPFSDSNLAAAEKRFSRSDRRASELREMLTLYQAILNGTEVRADAHNQLQAELLLCGLAARRTQADGRILLSVRNQIFARVFDKGWIIGQRTASPAAAELERWLNSGRSTELLLTGELLDSALAWAQQHPENNLEELEFITASLQRSYTTEQQRREQLQKRTTELEAQRRQLESRLQQRVRILWLTFGLYCIIFAAALAGSIYAGTVIADYRRDLEKVRQHLATSHRELRNTQELAAASKAKMDRIQDRNRALIELAELNRKRIDNQAEIEKRLQERQPAEEALKLKIEQLDLQLLGLLGSGSAGSALPTGLVPDSLVGAIAEVRRFDSQPGNDQSRAAQERARNERKRAIQLLMNQKAADSQANEQALGELRKTQDQLVADYNAKRAALEKMKDDFEVQGERPAQP